jgi:hypothetical protein
MTKVTNNINHSEIEWSQVKEIFIASPELGWARRIALCDSCSDLHVMWSNLTGIVGEAGLDTISTIEGKVIADGDAEKLFDVLVNQLRIAMPNGFERVTFHFLYKKIFDAFAKVAPEAACMGFLIPPGPSYVFNFLRYVGELYEHSQHTEERNGARVH